MTGPDYWPRLTTGLTIERSASLAAKYVVAIAAGLHGRDPTTRQLSAALPFKQKTIIAAIAEGEERGLARIDRRRGRRSIIHPLGIALPGKKGRRYYAIIPSGLFYAALAAGSGRKAAYGPLVIQRLLREQAKRGAAHVSPLVIAADLGLKPKLTIALLDALERSGTTERHRRHRLDSDEVRVYSVPLADALYPIDTSRLDAEQTRILDGFELCGHRLTVLGRRIDLDAVYHRIVDARAEFPEEVIAAIVGQVVAENLTAETLLAETLLNALRRTLIAASADTHPGLRHTPEPVSEETSISNVGSVGTVERRYADRQEESASDLDGGKAGPPENFAGDGDEGLSVAAPSTRPGSRTYQAPYHPSVSYTAQPETHERIAAMLDAVARRYGDDEAGGAAYEAVRTATEGWTRGATGATVLAALHRFNHLADSDAPPVLELDFGAIGGDDDGE